MKHRSLCLAFVLGIITVLGSSPAAKAGVLQLDLTALGRPVGSDTTPNQRFQSMVTELGAALGAGMMSPAESLGYSGFNFGLEMSWADIHQENSYWRGQPGHRVWHENGTSQGYNQRLASSLNAARIHVRKGLPLSFEVGATLTYMLAGAVGTDLYAVGAEVKWTLLHEKFLKQLPDIGVRFAANRLLGPQQLDLTQVQMDFAISYSFGLGGMVGLTPYAGYTLWTVHAVSQILESSPEASTHSGGDSGSLYTLAQVSWNENLQHRAFLGLRFIINFIEILGEVDLNFMNLQAAEKKLTIMPTYSVKFGFDY